MTLGERLKGWRLAAGLSQNKAATAAGINQSYLSALERGEHTPGPQTQIALARVYGIELAQLVTGNPLLQAGTAAYIVRQVDQQAAENQRRELAEALQAARAAENAAALARAEFEAELARLREHLAQIEANTEHGFRCLESRLNTPAYEGADDLQPYGELSGVAIETRIYEALKPGPLGTNALVERLGCDEYELAAVLGDMQASGVIDDQCSAWMLVDVPDDMQSLRELRNNDGSPAWAIYAARCRKSFAARKRGTKSGGRYWNQAYGGARA